MANQNDNLVYGWTPQQLGAVASQTGYASPADIQNVPTVSTGNQPGAGKPSPVPGNGASILENPGYGGMPGPTGALLLAATTGVSGYTLVNGTGNIITWTAPNDGAIHRFAIFSALHITSNETGGQITVSYTLPDATAVSHTLFAAGAIAGDQAPALPFLLPVQANTAVTVKQNTALTAGAAVMWAEIWAA